MINILVSFQVISSRSTIPLQIRSSMSCNDTEQQIKFEAPGDSTSHLALLKNDHKLSSNSFNNTGRDKTFLEITFLRITLF